MSVVSVTEIITGLFHPVFQHQARDPRKLSHIVRHQDGARRDGVPGNGRVIRADRRPGHSQRHLNLRGGVHRSAIPGQDGIEAGAERVDQLDVARGGLRAGAPKRISE